jgi:hypothetical protein
MEYFGPRAEPGRENILSFRDWGRLLRGLASKEALRASKEFYMDGIDLCSEQGSLEGHIDDRCIVRLRSHAQP